MIESGVNHGVGLTEATDHAGGILDRTAMGPGPESVELTRALIRPCQAGYLVSGTDQLAYNHGPDEACCASKTYVHRHSFELRPEERGVGKECLSRCKSRCSPNPKKK